MDNVIKFEVGQTYETRSICDYDCIFRVKIVKRTKKFVWVERHGEVQRRGVKVWSGVEACLFAGNYSMAPAITADQHTV